MATLSNHMQKIIRHYVPMIRFKYGANRTVDADQSISQTSKESSVKVNDAQKTELSTSLEFFETPTRYRRRPLSQEEIHLIEIGGRV